MKLLFLSLAITLGTLVPASAQPRENLSMEKWTGLTERRLVEGRSTSFTYPEGPQGRYKHGFRIYHDSTVDWRSYQGLEIDLQVDAGREIELTVTVLAPAGMGADERVSAKVRTSRSGQIRLPWSAFASPRARTSYLKFVKGVEMKVEYTDGKSGTVKLDSVAVTKGANVYLESAVSGKSSIPGGQVEYEVEVGNPSTVPQAVSVFFSSYGWQAMTAEVEPASFSLSPGETKHCRVRVNLPKNLPAGAHETQTLLAVGNGDAAMAARLEFITAARIESPFILHTPARWQEVREKVKNFDWAHRAQEEIVKKADAWEVPEVAKAPGNDPDDTMGPFLFPTATEAPLVSCGISWQLTGNRAHAEKVALFLRRLSDPETGYPKTLRGCNQGQVQEGHFFQNIAASYDMIQDAGVLTDKDREQIAVTFRLFMESISRLNDSGSINNWNVSEVTGALFCALAMQDLDAAKKFFSGANGICDQLTKGTMDDGWWYECSISYNLWVSRQMSQIALALEPWGINFKDMRLPASYARNVLLVPELNGGSPLGTADPEQRVKPFGMDPDVSGPLKKPYREIRDLWNGLLPFIDWRGVMFGVNDSTENFVVGGKTAPEPAPFEVAYYVYRDPAYAAMIKLSPQRDLLYGVPELPEKTPGFFRQSAVADNVGLAMLRSQTPDRPMREQIQAVLHYGTHGWAHGHFDRTGLLSLMRYGRSFYNPEAVWHSYEPFMYKFYVQTSVSKNMVVVDRKMQKASPGERLVFHSGRMMQATVVETTTPWGNPPYGGMVYDYVPVKTFEEKTWREGRHVPIPENPPGYGSITGYTEPIHQRRTMIVADDYVLLADELQGDQEHEFESLFQMKGFLGLEASGKKFLRHDGQWDADPLGSAQFVTDCDRYQVEAPAVSRFEMKFGPGADNSGTRAPFSEDGVLKLDVHTLWPASQEIMYGTAPEDHALGQRLFYKATGDGRLLTEGKFGAWTLGRGIIKVNVDGVKKLELETRTEIKRPPSLFWGTACVITRSGKEIPLAELEPSFENILKNAMPNLDYAGGPIKIQGELQAYATPAQPENDQQSGKITVDLSHVDAVEFKATIGSDYPPGPEEQRRKTMAVKAAKGKSARFMTLIEPYESMPMVRSAVAVSENEIKVELKDGRIQKIIFREEDGKTVIEMTETQGAQILHKELTEKF